MTGPRIRPVSPPRLVEELADRILAQPGEPRLRVAIDGAEAAAPQWLGGELIDPLRVRGRPALHLRTSDFLRPASLRLELGRTSPESFYERWFDEQALRREVLDRAGPDGDGRVLPKLWDADADRAARADYVHVPPQGVVLVSGALLLGGLLPFDFTVHLSMSPGALGRRTDQQRRWTLPAYEWYEAEVAPAALADVVVRVEDPQRPAVVDAW